MPSWLEEQIWPMRLVWLTRPDLQPIADLGRMAFLAWCLVEGRQEYRSFDPRDEEFNWSLVAKKWSGSPPRVEFPITELMWGVWRRRSDLMSTFDLTTHEGAESFIGWYVVEGIREFDLAPLFTNDQVTWLTNPVRLPAVEGMPVLTRIMVETFNRRPDLQEIFDLTISSDRRRCAVWFLTEGLREIGSSRFAGSEGRRWFQAQSTEALRLTGAKVSNGLYSIWSNDPDLRTHYPPTSHGMRRLKCWAVSAGAESYPLLSDASDALLDRAPTAASSNPGRFLLCDGVNLFGHVSADTGIGEDVRMVSRALDSCGIEHVIVDLDPGPAISKGEPVSRFPVVDEPLYRTSIICATGMETARALASRGTRLFHNQYVIGYWPWELADWPKEWGFALDLVDEIWAGSRHALRSYRFSTKKTVKLMPMAVAPPSPAPLERADFDLPDNVFLFLFSFDAKSYLKRKNPSSVVAAFQAAFPDLDEPVGLVLKVMRATSEEEEWKKILEIGAGDQRIHIRSETYSRHTLMALYNCCDSLVSLHRAEGFGRVLGEMMYLGKPVIATNWSGSTDFLTKRSGAPVRYDLVKIGDNDYPYSAGQSWAEPDVSDAARWMRTLVDQPELATTLGANGAKQIRHKASIRRVGARYRRRLDSLALKAIRS